MATCLNPAALIPVGYHVQHWGFPSWGAVVLLIGLSLTNTLDINQGTQIKWSKRAHVGTVVIMKILGQPKFLWNTYGLLWATASTLVSCTLVLIIILIPDSGNHKLELHNNVCHQLAEVRVDIILALLYKLSDTVYLEYLFWLRWYVTARGLHLVSDHKHESPCYF